MQKRFALWNPSASAVRIGDNILISARDYSDRFFDQDEIDFLRAELNDKHIRICTIIPAGGDVRRPRKLRPPASPRQQELYKTLTGRQFEAGTDRIEASRLIDMALEERSAAAEKLERRATPISFAPPDNSVEILAERLYAAHAPIFPKQVAGVTLIINWTSTPVQSADGIHVLNCTETERVDEMLLAGVVRLIAGAMRGRAQKVLLYGPPDAVAVTAACVLREHLAIPAEQAVRILRRVLPAALGKSALLETVNGYRMT